MGVDERQTHMRGSVAVVTLMVCTSVVTACSSGPAPYVAVPQVSGVRTADDGRTILLTYTGGACDAAPMTRVVQTPSMVTVSASIGSTAGHDACPAIGIPRTLAFQLSAPLAGRRVRDGLHGRPVPAFDGAVLTEPARLPTGYTERTDFQTPDVAGSWSRTWVVPGTSRRDELTITQSPHRLPGLTGAVVPGRHTVDGSPATATRDGSRDSLAVQWTFPGSPDSARIIDRYRDRPEFTVAQLLRIAASLPVGSVPTSTLMPTTTASAVPARPVVPPVAQVRPAFASGADDLCQPLIKGTGQRATTGRLPASATVTLARWCADDRGRGAAGIQSRQSVGSVVALDRALHERSTTVLPPGIDGCAAFGTPAIFLEVLDQHGRRFDPAWPSTACGPTSAVPDALAETSYRVLALPRTG